MAKKVMVIPANPTGISKVAKKNGRKTRVAAYCRVSTDNDQLGSFENQLEYFRNMIDERDDWELAGLFSDEGISGTGTKHRSGFMDMIQACEDGRVDLVITKSVSRFARNTADCLLFSRRLKNLGIPIIFEKEGLNTMDASGELLFTVLSSLAQEESRNISENTAWGIRSKFQQGIAHLNTTSILGYDKGEDGSLVINEEQAVVVRRIYRDFMDGWTVSEISRRLNVEGVPGVHGVAKWYPSTIESVIRNEKHVGDLLMQKTYTSDFLTKRQIANNGKLEQYFIRDDHPAIIPRDEWDAAQLELERREAFRLRHGLRVTGSSIDDPFYSRVFCEACGGKLIRHYWKGCNGAFWKCKNAEKRKGHICQAANVRESTLHSAVVAAWNEIVDSRQDRLTGWEEALETGNALQRHRARLMIAVTAEGPLDTEVPELTRMFLEEVIVHGREELEVHFLDGSRVRVSFEDGAAEVA